MGSGRHTHTLKTLLCLFQESTQVLWVWHNAQHSAVFQSPQNKIVVLCIRHKHWCLDLQYVWMYIVWMISLRLHLSIQRFQAEVCHHCYMPH